MRLVMATNSGCVTGTRLPSARHRSNGWKGSLCSASRIEFKSMICRPETTVPDERGESREETTREWRRRASSAYLLSTFSILLLYFLTGRPSKNGVYHTLFGTQIETRQTDQET